MKSCALTGFYLGLEEERLRQKAWGREKGERYMTKVTGQNRLLDIGIRPIIRTFLALVLLPSLSVSHLPILLLCNTYSNL